MVRRADKKHARKPEVKMSDRNFLQVLINQAKGNREQSYRAFYSSFLGGITTAAHHMVIPLDDHMAHRGDAVFEAIKFTSSGIFALERHLDRLEVSRKNIHLELPFSRRKLESVILSTVRASGLEQGLIRLFLSRGEGGFTTNPYEPDTSRVMCAITTLSAPSSDKYLNGVHVGISKIAVKEGFFARTKTCNYLPNVLMKKEALDRGLDFMVSLDESGYLAEGSTENFAIFDRSGTFVIPKYDRILKGVTLVRAAELAKQAGFKVQQRDIRVSEIQSARAAIMLGTTIDILPIGRMSLPGGVKRWKRPMESIPEVEKLSRLLQKDLAQGPLLRRFALTT
jgi:branched-subunit amino acid aminotransferase/4-amino-4-deoxychorismate lyase